jgi:hypothetical protein
MEMPDWVDWLAQQPPNVRLAAFPPARERPIDWWGYDPLLYRVKHHHRTLNGSDSVLFAADLKLLGATYEKMNPSGLRFIVSMGYDHLAFHRDYLESNSWITSLPWLRSIETRGPWLLCRADSGLDRLPTTTLDSVLATWPVPTTPIEVPAECWITDRFDLPHEVVVGSAPPVWATWTDSRGHQVGEKVRVLYQHIFGPQIPAFSVRTPTAPGDYRLAFADERNRALQSRPYRVSSRLDTVLSLMTPAHRDVDATEFVKATPIKNGHQCSLILENKSSLYLQANTSRDQVYLKSIRAHPGTLRTSAGSLVIRLRTASGNRQVPRAYSFLLPCDLPPRTSIVFTTSDLSLNADLATVKFSGRAHFIDVGEDDVGLLPAQDELARGSDANSSRK